MDEVGNDVAQQRCIYCGEPEHLDLHEVYADGTFQFDTCCGDLYEALCSLPPEELAVLLHRLDIGTIARRRLRRVVDDGLQLLADFHVEIASATFSEARDFVAQFHEHNPAPAGWRFGASVWNGWQKIGVIMVGRPVARMIDAASTCEVNRLCLRRDIADGLRWNAASMAYGWAAREARRRGYARIITYTREEESGVSLIAAGWDRDGVTKGGGWSRPSRPRLEKSVPCRKMRWSKGFHAAVQRQGVVGLNTRP